MLFYLILPYPIPSYPPQDPAKFLESLFKYDKENIPDATIQKIQTYIDSESFTPSAISKVGQPQEPIRECYSGERANGMGTNQKTLFGGKG